MIIIFFWFTYEEMQMFQWFHREIPWILLGKMMISLWWTNIAMDRSTIFNGKIHYVNGHFQLLCNKLPEGFPFLQGSLGSMAPLLQVWSQLPRLRWSPRGGAGGLSLVDLTVLGAGDGEPMDLIRNFTKGMWKKLWMGEIHQFWKRWFYHGLSHFL